ncbi:MAG: PilZ domain-containing protein [Nitrospiraceae bacterium]
MKEPHCPQCGTSFVRVTSQGNRPERLFSLLNFYPFRCQLCTQRFRVFWPVARGATQLFDRRQYRRLTTSCPVTFVTDQSTRSDLATDISMGGCTLQTNSPLPKGAFVELQLAPSPGEPAIKIETAMVCSVRDKSVGVQFLEFEPVDKHRLSQYVHGLLLSQNGSSEASV